MNNTQDIYPEIYDRLVNQFNQLKINYSKHLNVRIDFHYEINQPINLNKAYQDMLYLYHIFEANNDDVIGCQFVIEGSNSNRLHIHALFFIDGQRHQKYYPFYSWLQNFWLSAITGASHTVDCNDAKNYKYPIVGKVKSYNEKDYDIGIRYLALYFAKKEQKENIDNFYQCFTSKIKPKNLRGKPRSQVANLLPLFKQQKNSHTDNFSSI